MLDQGFRHSNGRAARLTSTATVPQSHPPPPVSDHDSHSVRRSIEVEYWVVGEEGRLVEPGPLVGASAGVEREFVEPVLEIKTTPCETTPELRAELFDRLGAVLDVADEHGLGLVPIATPLNADAVADRPSERTRIQRDIIGSDFEYVRHCAGTHIHVEQLPGREVEQLNTLVALDPALALVNSARRYRGQPLATGVRSKLYRWRAYDDLPHQGRLWRYVDSKQEWTRRLERRYEEFETMALEAGIDRQTFASSFDPESAVWTPVQFRAEFGTVEWRSPDTALPSNVLELAAHIADTVEHLQRAEVRIEGETGRVTEDQVVLPEFSTVLEHVNAAIRDGLGSDALRGYLERMGFDVAAFDPISERHERFGTMSQADARERRLEYAKRLRQDVRRTRSVSVE